MTKQHPQRRTKWMVDKPLQQGLSQRMLLYWCGTWLGIFAVPICVRFSLSSLPASQLATEMISDLWFPMMMSLLILPIVAWDCMRFSHRVAGPIFRISYEMGRLANGETVAPIRLRENDFCNDLADNFNQIIKMRSADSQTEDSEVSNVTTY